MSSYLSYDVDVETIFMCATWRFRDINAKEGLTEADKKQLKDFYLQHMVAPKARKLLEEHFPEEFGKAASNAGAPNNRPHRDRH